MKKKVITIAALLGAAFLGGCSYNVQSSSSPAVNIYSSYEDKVPGTFFVVLDDSVRTLNKEVSPSSYACGVHKYPVNIGETMAVSITQTMESVFQDTIEQASMPSYETLKDSGVQGSVLIGVKNFAPKISCSQGFWSMSCTATTDLVLEADVRGKNKRLLHTTAGATQTAQGDAGVYCGGGANVIAESINKATRDALERLSERLHNSNKIREAVKKI